MLQRKNIELTVVNWVLKIMSESVFLLGSILEFLFKLIGQAYAYCP